MMKSILRSIDRPSLYRVAKEKTALRRTRPLFLQTNRHTFASSTTTSSPTSSVSQEEVSKFSSLAPSWWNLDDNPLVTMNPVRTSFLRRTLSSRSPTTDNNTTTNHNRPFARLRALDVGCGGGLLSESLARLGAHVVAIDPSQPVATAARNHSLGLEGDEDTRGIDYRGGVSVEQLAQEEDMMGRFDMVCVLEVIEHTESPQTLLDAAASLIRPPCPSSPQGGTLFVSTINRTAKSYAVTILGGEYATGKLPVGTHDWNLYRSPEEVEGLVRECGGGRLEEVEKSGMVLKPPFLWDMEWELVPGDLDVNWIAAYGFGKS